MEGSQEGVILPNDYFNANLQKDSNEIFEGNALGNIASQLYPGYGHFFGVPCTANQELFELLSVFTKQGRSTFECIGSLRANGGLLEDETTDLLSNLRPHLHSSSKQDVDRYLIGLKTPFTRQITEFSASDLTTSPDGKFFSWLDMGVAQIEYVDPVKLAARLNNLKVRQENRQLHGKSCVYVVHKVWYSERLCYYPSKQCLSSHRLDKDKAAMEQQIKYTTKSPNGCCINVHTGGTRAFSVCRVPLSKDGRLGVPNYEVKLCCNNPFIQSCDKRTFLAEELDIDFIHWLTLRVKSMTTKRFWQPALRKLFSFPDKEDTRSGLKFLLETMKKFQTEEQSVIQLVDFSVAIPNTPSCMITHPSILAAFLRGAAIILTAPQKSDDGDDDYEKYEEQIVFQPENCQESLKILEALFTLLVEGVITEEQGRTVSQLVTQEVVSLQELFYTQMGCVCSPWKILNPREKPLSVLWKESSRTRAYLESLGLKETVQGEQVLVTCPENCQLLNILALFYDNID